jgi:DNA-binding XRE family transcriptional regulator
MRTFDGRQLTAARALAELTVIELAKAAGVTTRTVNRLEVGGVLHVSEKIRHGHVSRQVRNKIMDALAMYDVVLLPEVGSHGAGVRWMRARANRLTSKSP